MEQDRKRKCVVKEASGDLPEGETNPGGDEGNRDNDSCTQDAKKLKQQQPNPVCQSCKEELSDEELDDCTFSRCAFCRVHWCERCSLNEDDHPEYFSQYHLEVCHPCKGKFLSEKYHELRTGRKASTGN